MEQATHFLFVVRHPLDRFVSWFKYVSPLNCNREDHRSRGPKKVACRNLEQIDRDPKSWEAKFFFHCFAKVNDFALALTGQQFNERHCKDRVMKLLKGYGPENVVGHLIANYQFYFRNTVKKNPTKPVYVLRTEKLWEDIKTLDTQHLNGTGEFGELEGLRLEHGSDQFADQTVVESIYGTQMLCCALFREFEIYEKLITVAQNLKSEEKQTTLQSTAAKCKFQNWTHFRTACVKVQEQHDKEQAQHHDHEQEQRIKRRTGV